MKRTLLALLLIVAAAYAYDGPLVTPAPSVRPGLTVLVTWDIRSFAERSYPPQSRPTHVFYEVSRDSSFRRDARVASGGDLPLKGKVALDTRRAPGEYFVRIVAKRGGNTPQHDVARRSSAVRFSVGSAQALTSLRIDPPSAPIDVPEGRTRFRAIRAILSEGQGEIDWSVEGGNTYGKIIPDFEDSSRATLVAPEQLPPGTTRIRIRARLRSDPSVAASAEAHVRYRVEPVTGTPTPHPVGPQPSPTASPPSGRLPGADNVVQVSAFTVTPSSPFRDSTTRCFSASATAQARTSRA